MNKLIYILLFLIITNCKDKEDKKPIYLGKYNLTDSIPQSMYTGWSIVGNKNERYHCLKDIYLFNDSKIEVIGTDFITLGNVFVLENGMKIKKTKEQLIKLGRVIEKEGGEFIIYTNDGTRKVYRKF